MKQSIVATLFLFALVLCVASLSAQAQTQTVYEVRGPNGPLYSDKPMPGARAIELPPLNVVDFKSAAAINAVAIPSAAPASAVIPANPTTSATQRKPESSKAIITGYRSFAIVAPENNAIIIAPAAVFEVRLALEPALLLGEGHAFTVSINGKALGQRFTATEFMIPAEFWGDTLPPPNQRYQLSARIVDRDGTTLKEATPAVFTLRYALARARVPTHPGEPLRPPVPTQTERVPR